MTRISFQVVSSVLQRNFKEPSDSTHFTSSTSSDTRSPGLLISVMEPLGKEVFMSGVHHFFNEFCNTITRQPIELGSC